MLGLLGIRRPRRHCVGLRGELPDVNLIVGQLVLLLKLPHRAALDTGPPIDQGVNQVANAGLGVQLRPLLALFVGGGSLYRASLATMKALILASLLPYSTAKVSISALPSSVPSAVPSSDKRPRIIDCLISNFCLSVIVSLQIVMPKPILPHVFPQSCGAWLGVDMPTVGVGEAVFPVLTKELDVRTPAENAAADETTGAFSAEVLSPSRIQASFFYSREDRARFAGMDEALRENLSMGLADGLDKQIIAGTNGLLTGTNLDNHNVSTQTTYALYRDQFAYGRVDGRYASMTSDIRVVMGGETYSNASAQYRGNNDNMDALMSLQSALGGVKVSAHVAAVSGTKQNAIIRLGMRKDMVAALWSNIALVPDEITLISKGQIQISAIMLHAVKILRTDGFYKQQTQHS